MKTSVRTLQHDAQDSKVAVSELLRRTLLLASRLGVDRVVGWARLELNGYGVDEEPPTYRTIHGQVMAYDPHRGLVPVHIGDSRVREMLVSRQLKQPIGQIESVLRDRTSAEAPRMPLPQALIDFIWSRLGAQVDVAYYTDYGQLQGILDGVRTAVLEWTIELEEKSVVGDEESVSQEERASASQVSTNINNFYGNVYGTTINQAAKNEVLQKVGGIDVEALKAFALELRGKAHSFGLPAEAAQELVAEAETVIAQASSPRPKFPLLHMSMAAIQRILESGAGTLVGEYLVRAAEFIAQMPM